MMMPSNPRILLVLAAFLIGAIQPSSQASVSTSSSTSSASNSVIVNGKPVVADCVMTVNGVTAPCAHPELLANVPSTIVTTSP
ncbi:uncharacterized protein PGTG_07004 [Puccinia graminis f. sp. tritici CRL 75-36-700-3]|uniref:Uncharacterized protein n=1 Tax=Puccinia graminis f. sp. tritici (strain CRL 75-36-700-3 / race SCCL) TaxID=418459 RepID=E3KA92_PUCGT|nr:uncharacterized protein PGTG_07004 [Puccinia graminis f. sp. tritici CRL 75-36-700-3]EFP81383.2 hypothetical protein PGTG_07004 [Puccinia graminis f. sp. tritici CRL 75-36-700-3]